jgi:hypothetical protein
MGFSYARFVAVGGINCGYHCHYGDKERTAVHHEG